MEKLIQSLRDRVTSENCVQIADSDCVRVPAGEIRDAIGMIDMLTNTAERDALAARLEEIGRAEPVCWAAIDPSGGGSVEYTAAWREACHEHINDCVSEQIMPDAASWIVRPLYDRPTAPAKREQLTEDEKYALIKKHLGLDRRRYDTVIDNRSGRWTDAARYFALIDEAFAHGIGTVVEKPAQNTPETAQPVDFADVLRGGSVGGKCCRTCGPEGCSDSVACPRRGGDA